MMSRNELKSLADKYDLPEEAIQPEMFDFLKVVAMGAKKYAMNNWLDKDGKRSAEKDMHDSMFHHLAESYSLGQEALAEGLNAKFISDKESGVDPLLHLACRALMLYTRRQRGIVHTEDGKNGKNRS